MIDFDVKNGGGLSGVSGGVYGKARTAMYIHYKVYALKMNKQNKEIEMVYIRLLNTAEDSSDHSYDVFLSFLTRTKV